MNKKLISVLTAIALNTSLVTTAYADTISSNTVADSDTTLIVSDTTSKDKTGNSSIGLESESENTTIISTENVDTSLDNTHTVSPSTTSNSENSKNTESQDTSIPLESTSEDSITTTFEDSDSTISLKDTNAETTTSTSTTITLGTISSFEGSGVTIDNNTITITQGGTYIISGTLKDGQIVVNAPKEDVNIVLNEANISCSTS